MKKVSVLIVAKNEANHIRECIESCRFDKEVIVIDDHSTDNTAEIAEGLGAKVFQRHLNGDFGAQKTFAIEQAGGEWVFLIDADERCTPELSDEISKIVQMAIMPPILSSAATFSPTIPPHTARCVPTAYAV